MSAFIVFCLWLLGCWLLLLRAEPLQPDRLEDDLGDVDMSDRGRVRAMREADWWERPVVNLKLARRGRRS